MAKADARHIDIGISEEDRAKIAAVLPKLLADLHALPGHAQFSLERDRADIQHSTCDAHDPVSELLMALPS